MEINLIDIFNFIFLGVIPLLIKFLNNLNKQYSELKIEIEKLKVVIQEIREDLKEIKKIKGD